MPLLTRAAPPSMSAELPMAAYAPPRNTWNRMLIVGEAPGAEEIRQNQPFVGRSGQLLDKALTEAGMLRADCFVANVFRYQPPGNKVDHFFASRRAAQQVGEGLAEDLGKFGGKYCRARFADEIAHLQRTIVAQKPAVLLAVGRTPLWALTGVDGITAHAGQTLPCRFMMALPVVVTYHPSYILRGNWRLMTEWVGHMRQAQSLAAAARL
ncbi:MAG: uracil-DNA glycosylase [Alphaproteobacteria bacterium]|nr:uracil-DNA glycosylase [Alphaproteobacteria bacterium]